MPCGGRQSMLGDEGDPELDESGAHFTYQKEFGALRSSFYGFTLNFILCSLNIQTYSLAKDVRLRVENYTLGDVKDLLRLAHETSLYGT
ncbi:hypothetical protein DY000_02034997 [Brassica cretica]|uniref:Uncharacterized protein n=1 Tax=Brassica cretica TaxID=69181 RepID=A0ABQ7DFJ2_BRACR|nr:hypothetical protein DY000_02034997 [Brassica cretica]